MLLFSGKDCNGVFQLEFDIFARALGICIAALHVIESLIQAGRRPD